MEGGGGCSVCKQPQPVETLVGTQVCIDFCVLPSRLWFFGVIAVSSNQALTPPHCVHHVTWRGYTLLD